jgi:hypothetical protein
MASTTTPSKKLLPTSTSSGGAAGSGRISPTATRTPTTIHKSRGSVHMSNGTPLSARASVRKPTPSSSATSLSAAVDVESAHAKMDELKERLDAAESSAADLRRQNDFLQAKLDDSGKEQAQSEERLQEDEERIEELENQKRELLKQKRELESIFEAERVQEMKTKEFSSQREQEMQAVIQRLKESLSQKQQHSDSASRAGEEYSLSRDSMSPLTNFFFILAKFSDRQLYRIVITHPRRKSFCAPWFAAIKLFSQQLVQFKTTSPKRQTH